MRKGGRKPGATCRRWSNFEACLVEAGWRWSSVAATGPSVSAARKPGPAVRARPTRGPSRHHIWLRLNATCAGMASALKPERAVERSAAGRATDLGSAAAGLMEPLSGPYFSCPAAQSPNSFWASASWSRSSWIAIAPPSRPGWHSHPVGAGRQRAGGEAEPEVGLHRSAAMPSPRYMSPSANCAARSARCAAASKRFAALGEVHGPRRCRR